MTAELRAAGSARGGCARTALLLAFLLGSAGPAAALLDGPPWELPREAGCSACHFGAPVVTDSGALSIEGLPARVEAGEKYRLVLRLADADMRLASFLLGAWRGDASVGEFDAADERGEARGALARSTRLGTELTAPGSAEWTLEWRAPRALDGPVRFEVWANASDDDRSPLGDVIHHRAWVVPPAAQ